MINNSRERKSIASLWKQYSSSRKFVMRVASYILIGFLSPNSSWKNVVKNYIEKSSKLSYIFWMSYKNGKLIAEICEEKLVKLHKVRMSTRIPSCNVSVSSITPALVRPALLRSASFHEETSSNPTVQLRAPLDNVVEASIHAPISS